MVIGFFRAISFSLTGSEDAHGILRSKMCKHINENPTLFKGLLRSSNQSLENYIKKMSNVGTWATEFEIIAMSHMLEVHIFTYSEYAWKRFSGSLIDNHFSPIEGGIYLDHVDGNHYNVVESVFNSNVIPNINTVRCNTVDDTIVRNLKRTKEKETSEDYASLRYEHEKKRRKLWFQNQYTNNDQFRRKILSRRKEEYICQKEKKLNKLKIKYKEMENYRSKLRKLNRDKYKMNEKHRENLKKKQ